MKANYFTNQIFRCAFKTIALLVVLTITSGAFAQSVTIMPGGITPNQSGAVPRLSYEAIMALPNPQNGDMAYDVTFDCLRLYKRTKWVRIFNDTDLKKPLTIAWKIGGAKYDMGHALATDASGNVYVAGYFQESALFGTTQVTATGVENYTIFIAKYTSTGNLLWVQKAGSATSLQISAMAIDSNGNIYLTGHIYMNATFGALNLTTAGGKDIFLAKYASDGTFQWVQKAGGPLEDEATDIVIDSNDHLYICGHFGNNAVLGGVTYTSAGGFDVFIMKYTNNGSFEWLRKGGGNGDDRAKGMVLDNDGKLTVIGSHTATATFGNKTFTSNGVYDVLVVQYDIDGNFKWAQTYGGTGSDEGVDIAVDSNGYLYLIGNFNGTMNSPNLTSAGSTDVFLIKLSDTGGWGWAKRGGGTSVDFGRSIAVDNKGDVFIAGEFSSPSTFGSTTLNSNDGAEVYIAKYNNNGGLQWIQEIGGNGQEMALKIVTDTKSNVYATGYFNTEFIYGDNSFNTTGLYDVFVLRVRD